MTAKEQVVATNTQDDRKRRLISPRAVGLVVLLVVAVLAILSTRVVSIHDNNASVGEKFKPDEVAESKYSSVIVPQIESKAVDLVALLPQIKDDAGKAKFGHSSGTGSAYAFPVTLTAVAGDATPPVLPLKVDGLPEGTTVVMQIGPAVNGTAIRDVTDTFPFSQFVNQLDYQKVATELNNQVKKDVLEGLDLKSLAGKTLKITGAFTAGTNPAFISIVPVKVEVLP